MYFRDLLPRLVKEGDDGNYGSAAVCDTICLQVWILAKLSIFKKINLVWMTWVGIYFSLVQYKLTIVHSLFWAFEWTIVVCEGFFFFFGILCTPPVCLGCNPPFLIDAFYIFLFAYQKDRPWKLIMCGWTRNEVVMLHSWRLHILFQSTIEVR